MHGIEALVAIIPVTPVPTPNPGVDGTTRPLQPDPEPRGHIGRVVTGSLATGLLAGLLLPFAPFIRAQEAQVTGAVLCGFALGWAMLAVLSIRFTDQPQRWAIVPALVMGAGGLLLIWFGSSVDGVLSWVWPPVMLALAIWMIVQVHRKLRSRSRWLLYPVVALLALASIGGGYQTFGAAADARAYPMPGQLISVGGHSLHLNCTGSGTPTVVLEPGMGEMSSNHARIAPAVASGTRVCVYDRAGRGWSQPADTVQDARQIATDLHTLLQRANVPGPYVLAGHSFGGRYVLTFAAQYPGEVTGMVLIDSTAPASSFDPATAAPADPGAYDVVSRIAALVSTPARLGVSRLYAPAEAADLPPQPRGEVRASIASTTNLRSLIEEFLQGNASAQQAAALRDFADKPLVVLTAGVGSASDHLAAQDRLATLSTNTSHRVIDGATHDSLISSSQGAATTAKAILDVVSSVRNAEPLDR